MVSKINIVRIMHWKLSLTAIVFLLSGCGFNSDEPVYDTANNPEGFPLLAVELLEQIEGGELRGFDAIAGGFGDLYTEHTDLLDSEPWRAVIDRLGSKFGLVADSLRELGLESYRGAAEYYQLASFARPQDKQLYHRASTFETWRLAFESRAVDLAAVVDGTEPELENYLAVARFFSFGDQDQRAFFDENLRVAFHDRLRKANQLTSSKLDELEAADRCLATSLEWTKEPIDFRLASFEEPSVDLLACRLTQVDSAAFIAEAYIVPREPVSADLTVAIRMIHSDSPDQPSNMNYSQLQVMPEKPPTEWEVGDVLSAARKFDYDAAPTSLQVSMIDRSDGRAKYLALSDGKGSFLKLDSSAMVTF